MRAFSSCLPPDRVDVRSRQMDVDQWGKLGADLENGRRSSVATPGFYIRRPGGGSAQRLADKSGARGPASDRSGSRPPGYRLQRPGGRLHGRAVRGERGPGVSARAARPGREGTVYVQFVVDTTGLVDTASVRILSSPDPQFEAVGALGARRTCSSARPSGAVTRSASWSSSISASPSPSPRRSPTTSASVRPLAPGVRAR